MQLSPSFAFASGIKTGLIDVILAPASHILENYIRDVRHDGAMSERGQRCLAFESNRYV